MCQNCAANFKAKLAHFEAKKIHKVELEIDYEKVNSRTEKKNPFSTLRY